MQTSSYQNCAIYGSLWLIILIYLYIWWKLLIGFPPISGYATDTKILVYKLVNIQITQMFGAVSCRVLKIYGGS